MKFRLSVIIISYNVGSYLKRCLESVMDLDDRVFEILCIDDGSTDNSVMLIEYAMKRDNRIKLFKKNNGGICSARNLGIKKASGDYIMFLDGDDYLFPDSCRELLNEIEQLDYVDGVWTGYVRKDWNGTYQVDTKLEKGLLTRAEIDKLYIPSILGISYEKLYSWFRGEVSLNEEQELPTIWRGLYSRKVLQRNNILFDETLISGEDQMFNWRFYAVAETLWVTHYNYYCYEWRKNSVSQEINRKFYEGRKRIVSARNQLNTELIKAGKQDYSCEYQGTLVMTKIQMAIMLSKCCLKELPINYRMFHNYSNEESIRRAFDNLCLKDAPLKYCIVLAFAKYKLDFLLFMGGWFINKMGIHVYPDE